MTLLHWLFYKHNFTCIVSQAFYFITKWNILPVSLNVSQCVNTIRFFSISTGLATKIGVIVIRGF